MKWPWQAWRRARHKRLPGGGLRLQILRRSLQGLVLAALFLIPSLSNYENLRNQRDDVGIQGRFDRSEEHTSELQSH